MRVIWVQNMLVFVVVWFLLSCSPKSGKWRKKCDTKNIHELNLCVLNGQSQNIFFFFFQKNMMYFERKGVTTLFCLLLQDIFRIHYTRQISLWQITPDLYYTRLQTNMALCCVFLVRWQCFPVCLTSAARLQTASPLPGQLPQQGYSSTSNVDLRLAWISFSVPLTSLQ